MRFSCIILAGGEGRRVAGKDKGLLLLKNKPLIEHIITTVSHQVDEIIISANRNLDDYTAFGYRVVTDSASNYRGPMAGVAAALPYCSHNWALIVPCDMPYLSSDLIERLAKNTGQNDICIAESEGKLQLVFLINKKLLPSLEQTLARDQLKLMHWVRQQDPKIIYFDEKDYFKNFNMTSDFDNN